MAAGAGSGPCAGRKRTTDAQTGSSWGTRESGRGGRFRRSLGERQRERKGKIGCLENLNGEQPARSVDTFEPSQPQALRPRRSRSQTANPPARNGAGGTRPAALMQVDCRMCRALAGESADLTSGGTDRLATAIFDGRRKLQPEHDLIFNDQDPWNSRGHASTPLWPCGQP